MIQSHQIEMVPMEYQHFPTFHRRFKMLAQAINDIDSDMLAVTIQIIQDPDLETAYRVTIAVLQLVDARNDSKSPFTVIAMEVLKNVITKVQICLFIWMDENHVLWENTDGHGIALDASVEEAIEYLNSVARSGFPHYFFTAPAPFSLPMQRSR